MSQTTKKVLAHISENMKKWDTYYFSVNEFFLDISKSPDPNSSPFSSIFIPSIQCMEPSTDSETRDIKNCISIQISTGKSSKTLSLYSYDTEAFSFLFFKISQQINQWKTCTSTEPTQCTIHIKPLAFYTMKQIWTITGKQLKRDKFSGIQMLNLSDIDLLEPILDPKNPNTFKYFAPGITEETIQKASDINEMKQFFHTFYHNLYKIAN